MISLVWQLAVRFRKSKKRSGFTAFIASSSTVGIGLGCFVLILLLSVMNGFEKELKDRLLAAIPHGELRAVPREGMHDWRNAMQVFAAEPGVKQVQPFIKATALLQRGKRSKAVELTAIDPALSDNDSVLNILPKNGWQDFSDNQHGILLGRNVLQHLGLQVGDKVQVLLPKQSDDLKLSAPDSIWLTVTGEIVIGGELDSFLAFMHMDVAADMLGVTEGAEGLSFRFNDPFQAFNMTREFGFRLTQHVYMSDWTRTHGHLYQDIQLVRTVVYLALTLVIAVASFNIVSSLVMSVSEKQAEIAMLKTMGAQSFLIATIFVLQGSLNGVIGIIIGATAGVLLSQHLSEFALFWENLFGIQLLSGDIYFIDFLPSMLIWRDVWITVSIALLLSILATLYPAIRASRVDPAVVLGH